MGDNGNDGNDLASKEVLEGAWLKLKDIKRADGILTRPNNANSQGVLARCFVAIEKDVDYRQELKTAYWMSPEESDLAIEAINERVMCGVPIGPLVDKIVARAAGTDGRRLRDILWAYSHSIVDTGQQGGDGKKKHFWQKGNGSNGNNDPISST